MFASLPSSHQSAQSSHQDEMKPLKKTENALLLSKYLIEFQCRLILIESLLKSAPSPVLTEAKPSGEERSGEGLVEPISYYRGLGGGWRDGDTHLHRGVHYLRCFLLRNM